MSNIPFKNLHHLFRNSAYHIHQPERDWLFRKVDGVYKPITYKEGETMINAVSANMLAQGVSKGEKVAFLTENCPEYFLFDQGLQQVGIVNASIYPTLSESEIEFIYNDSEAKGVLVGSPFLLKKLKKVSENLPNLNFIITVFDEPEKIWNDPKVKSWKHYIQEGVNIYPEKKEEIEGIYEGVGFNDTATLLYTSGTTGNPKGAILTHGNFLNNAASGLTLMNEFTETEMFLSFLPLSHVYERCVSYYIGLYKGSQVAFAENIEKIATNVGEIKPTILATVPRLLEKIEEKVRKNVEIKGGISLKIFEWAIAVGAIKQHKLLNGGYISPWLKIQSALAEKLVYTKIKNRLGGRIHFIVSGGAACPIHVANFFAAIGIKVLEGYGLTETSPFITVNEFNRQLVGTVGRVGPGQQVAIQNPDTLEIYTIQTYDNFKPSFESAEGEILMKGPNLMKGYWKQEHETAKVIDSEGWFHTGDIGKFYMGNLKITDRLKNIIVNSFGKNIYPTQVENVYLKSRKIEQIFIIGDKREYLTAIIVPSKDELKEYFNFSESYFTQDEIWINDSEVMDWLKADIQKLGLELAKFERIKGYIIKRNSFSIENGEMTPKQSVKRKVVESKFKKEIDDLYDRTGGGED